MSAPHGPAVSAFLGRRFNRSEVKDGKRTEGFTVRRALGHGVRKTDWVTVEYEPGAWMEARYASDPDGLLARTQRVLIDYERNLKTRYDIARNDEDGEDQWNCLLVRNKTEREKS